MSVVKMSMRTFALTIVLMVVSLLPTFAQGTATTRITVTPNAAAYNAADCVGGVLTVPGMVRINGPGGTIVAQVTITDTTGTDAAIDILFFDAAPTGTYTDHAACDIAAADTAHLVGLVENSTFTCIQDQATTIGTCQATPAVLITPASLPVKSSNIWAVPIMRGTPTYGAGASLYFFFKAFPD